IHDVIPVGFAAFYLRLQLYAVMAYRKMNRFQPQIPAQADHTARSGTMQAQNETFWRPARIGADPQGAHKINRAAGDCIPDFHRYPKSFFFARYFASWNFWD